MSILDTPERFRSACISGPNRITSARSFLRNVEFTPTCWEWTATWDRDGYPQWFPIIGGKRRTVFAHRVAFEAVNGPVPTGMELDHRCFNRRCVRPDHLEVVTHAENCRRKRDRDAHAKPPHGRGNREWHRATRESDRLRDYGGVGLFGVGRVAA